MQPSSEPSANHNLFAIVNQRSLITIKNVMIMKEFEIL